MNLQVYGLLTVVVTTTGTLWFTDDSNVASTRGLDAAGILLLILNVACVLLMAVFIVLAARGNIKKYSLIVLTHVKTKSAMSRSSMAQVLQAQTSRREQRSPRDQLSNSGSGAALFTSPSSSYVVS